MSEESRPTIILLTDFSDSDWYVAAMKGVLLKRVPQATLVDLTHAIPPGDVRRAAFVLAQVWLGFPNGSVFLAVVDPGVGTERRHLAVSILGRYFVGPDNGVFSTPLRFQEEAVVRSIALDGIRVENLSRTFHGRDVFAPAAAHLAAGGDFDAIGELVTDPIRLPEWKAEFREDEVAGEVVYVDHFGNCITNVFQGYIDMLFARQRSADFNLLRAIHASRVVASGVWATYREAPVDAPFALPGSHGFMEIAVREGNAAARTGLKEGDEIRFRIAGDGDPAENR